MGLKWSQKIIHSIFLWTCLMRATQSFEKELMIVKLELCLQLILWQHWTSWVECFKVESRFSLCSILTPDPRQGARPQIFISLPLFSSLTFSSHYFIEMHCFGSYFHFPNMKGEVGQFRYLHYQWTKLLIGCLHKHPYEPFANENLLAVGMTAVGA